MHLAHQFLVEVLRVGCSDYMYPYTLSNNLVAWKDTLLLLGYNKEAFYYIDFSTKPTKYLRLEAGGLKNWVSFFDWKHVGQMRFSVNQEKKVLCYVRAC